MWDPVSDDCEVCECSSMIKSGFKLSEQCCNNFRHDDLDKENIQQRLGNSPLKHESDLSLYGNSSPQRPSCHGSSPHCTHQRRPLEDHDGNSQDSGYGTSCPGEGDKFYKIAKSLGVTPRQDCSPVKNCGLSFGSMDSMDDEFLEFTDLEHSIDENSRLPTDFNALITGSFTTTTNSKESSPEYTLPVRPPLRRSISLTVNGQTPNSSRVRSCLFKNEDMDFRSFKRPEPPVQARSPIQNKRFKVVREEGEQNDEEDVLELAAVPVSSRPVLRRSVSATEESIKYALQRSTTEPDLIGDFSKAFCLPLTTGRHQDLKSITPTTLALVMRGEFSDSVTSYRVIDCRYPYEYDGGHVNGATNLYTKDQILGELLDINSTPPATSDPRRRQILVFHCEFSSERGPNLYRFLRNLDRIRNKDVYPALHYPEIYLLEGGYKSFYEQYPELCVPEAYKPMLHPEHQNDLRHFRSKSKTWNADRCRSNSKGSLKRLGFF
ncbi:hypothetical protein ILUMI_20468 [Ignelater luminosus]|uniref:protein-tyrosine-phosphatase n=1 Tax=Ignelater luminosus TaxID=2038154 RepID=A0A8K0CE31_IGNLU|nr:hypothetical protein ILUMI_20468 [Ignelater luminosus]